MMDNYNEQKSARELEALLLSAQDAIQDAGRLGGLLRRNQRQVGRDTGNKTLLVEKLTFLQTRRQQDETTLLAQAIVEGIQVLYREELVEAYLLGQVPREMILEELGAEELEAVEYQRDAFRRDVNWGMYGA